MSPPPTYNYGAPAVPAQQYRQALADLRAQYLYTNQQLGALTAQNAQQIKELEQRSEAALVDFAAGVLPTFDQAALHHAVAITGYLPLEQSDPLTAMSRTREQLTKRVAEIEEDRRYRDRMLLRAPRIGMLTREITELEEFSQPLRDLVSKCEHERLEHLLQVGYGTPTYTVPFWRMSYYTDWRAGDQICANFGGKKPFAEIRSELTSARETIAVYDSKLDKLRAEVQAGELIESEHDAALSRIATLPDEFLAHLRGQLASYLRDIDLVAIGDRLALEPKIDGLAKRYLGLTKQTAYLRDSGQHLLKNTVAPVQQTLQKLDYELVKYQRPKLQYAQVPGTRMSKLQQMAQRNAKSQQQAQRYQQTSTVVYQFDNYRYGRIDDDFLWWDLMTHSYAQRYDVPKINGNFIPEVADFRANHPDYRYQTASAVDMLADDESRAAAASLSLDDDDRTNSSSDIS